MSTPPAIDLTMSDDADTKIGQPIRAKAIAASQPTDASPQPQSTMRPPSIADKWPPPSAYNEIIRIIVGRGDEKKTYSIHKGVLAFYSGYWSSLSAPDSEEAKSNRTSLPDAEVKVWDVIQNWLYSHQLHPAIAENRKKLSKSTVLRVWLWADASDMPALQNAALDLLHQKICDTWSVPTREINYVYESTLTGAPLRKYLIDIIAKTSGPEEVLGPASEDSWCKEALLDLARLTWTSWLERTKSIGGKRGVVRGWNLCKYHVHEEGTKCGKQAAT